MKNTPKINWPLNGLIAFWIVIASFTYSLWRMPEEFRNGALSKIEETHQKMGNLLEEYDNLNAETLQYIISNQESDKELMMAMLESLRQMTKENKKPHHFWHGFLRRRDNQELH